MKFSVKNFIFQNHYKDITVKVFIYSALYRMQILFVSPAKMKKRWGAEGEESSHEETEKNYEYAVHVSQAVYRVCNKTDWESKCLVRALTARRLLYNAGIHTTLYLGCKYDQGKMSAHAWLRCGDSYVTGGEIRNDYAVVDKFYL